MEISGMQMYLEAITRNIPLRIPRLQTRCVVVARLMRMAMFSLSKLSKMAMFTLQKITGQQMTLR